MDQIRAMTYLNNIVVFLHSESEKYEMDYSIFTPKKPQVQCP